MAAGGLMAGRKVLVTLAHKVTDLPLNSSLAASTTSAVLVGLASWNGLPVSTTHVTTGGIVGAGLRRSPRSVRWRTVREIVLSWVVTLPVAGLLAAAVVFLLGS
jgi:inorganic phosphate transporter, PiT family